MKTTTTTCLLLGAGAVAVGLGYAFYATSRFSVELAPYSVIRTDGDFEIRDYPELLTARTPMSGQDDAFRRLFGFIDRGNSRREKIPMTSPVLMDADQGMSFVLPGRMAASGRIPDAVDGRVTVLMRPAARVVVFRYSGGSSRAERNAAVTRLRQWASARKIAIEGDPIVAYYDSPFIPGFLRRNEVMFAM